jgi:hypothetical protein
LMVMALSVVFSHAQQPPGGRGPSIVGSWNITFFLEPDHTQGATQCVEFTLNPGSVVGEPLEGQWSSPTFISWGGDWFQEGEHVQWYGSTSGSLATSEYGDLASSQNSQGKFNHFFLRAPGSSTSSAGAWTGTRVDSCSSPDAVLSGAPSSGDDPASR